MHDHGDKNDRVLPTVCHVFCHWALCQFVSVLEWRHNGCRYEYVVLLTAD